VPDAEGASGELRDRNVKMLYDEVRSGPAHSKVNFAHPKSTGGVLVELVEPGEEN
jgi:methylmalonyl-CoA/ethylmalonyl-CoA epimerase